MEKVALNNLQLDHLASMHPKLSRVFYGTDPCDVSPEPYQTKDERLTLSIQILTTDQASIGLPCGRTTTCVRFWTVMGYH